MTQREYDEFINEYISRNPINKRKRGVTVKRVKVVRGVNAEEFLKKIREKYITNQSGIISPMNNLPK